MARKATVSLQLLALLAMALLVAEPAAATEVTWSYSGQVTFTDFPDEFPVGSPVHLEVTVDPDLQTLVSATAVFNGFAYEVPGPRMIANVGMITDFYLYYTSGPATGPTVGEFTPWFGTFFFRGDYGPLFTYEPFWWAQSFVFEDGFGRSVGAAGLTVDIPPTPQELLTSLVADVVAMNVRAGIGTSLDAKLEAALAAIEDENVNNDVAATNGLYAFIHEVEAQRGKKLRDSEARFLVESAEAIILALGG